MAVSAWRGVRLVKAPLPFVRTAMSSQRAPPVNTPPPKSSATVNKPLVTPTEAVVTGAATMLPLTSAS